MPGVGITLPEAKMLTTQKAYHMNNFDKLIALCYNNVGPDLAPLTHFQLYVPKEPSMLDLYELYVFLHAAETQNFSEAARRLHLTQPAVSLNIKSLEKRLEVKLFQHVGRNVVLTEAGQALLPLARELVSLSNRIEESVCALRGKVVGQLTIGCATSAARYVLPPIIGRFKQRYPQVKISMVSTDCDSMARKLLDKQINIGVTCVKKHHPDLEYREFIMDELALVVPPDHPWARRQDVSIAELKDQNLILQESGASSRRILLEELGKQGIVLEDLRVVMELGSCDAVEIAVESGLGVSVVCKLAAKRSLEMGRLVAVPIRDAVLKHPIYLVGMRKEACSCAQLRFCELVHSEEIKSLLEQLTA